MPERTVVITVRLPVELHARLGAESERVMIGRNKLMVIAIEDLLARLDKVEGRK